MSASPLPPTPSSHGRATGRRNVLRAAAWTTPAVILSAAAPAFANSSPPAGRLQIDPGTDTETREIVVHNEGEELQEFRLEFTPAPDAATVGALVAYSGFHEFRRVSSDPFVLAGSIPAGEQSSAWAWWRDRASSTDLQATTTVRLYADGTLLDEITVSLSN